MFMKIFAMLVVAFALSACEPNPTETNSNTEQKPSPTAQASPTTAASPEPSVSAIKTGDKVKAVNGSLHAALSSAQEIDQHKLREVGRIGEIRLAIGHRGHLLHKLDQIVIT